MMKVQSYQAIKSTGSNRERVEDHLITEAALAIILNGEPLTVTMQTPGNENELVRGLLFTEGIYKNRNVGPEMTFTTDEKSGQITHVNVQVSPEEAGVINKRSLLSVAACGICGKKELDFVSGEVVSDWVFELKNLPGLFEKMSAKQSSFLLSGGCHASAAFSGDGEMFTIMEDVGRHNAVDKVVGDLLIKKKLKETRIILVSGRVSYEIVAKVFAAGIPVLAAVSAPSTLSVDFAKELGITLLGFCRDDRATIYANPQRVK